MSNGKYPKTLHHPHFKKGTTKAIQGTDSVSGRPFTDYQGEPDMFPPVTVMDETSEGMYRAKGYFAEGESPTPPAHYAEYPVMLSHPDHVDAVPETQIPEKTDQGIIVYHRVLGTSEQFPPVMVSNRQEEEAWVAKGYRRVGSSDPEAVRRSFAAPYNENFTHSEYPKMVNGEVLDPDAEIGDPVEYPKYIGETLVHSRAEEIAITGQKPNPPVTKCVICGEFIHEDDPAGEGAMGAYHLAHMAAPIVAQSEAHVVDQSEHLVPVATVQPGALTRGQKAAATRAANKAKKESGEQGK